VCRQRASSETRATAKNESCSEDLTYCREHKKSANLCLIQRAAEENESYSKDLLNYYAYKKSAKTFQFIDSEYSIIE
jgi:hypothetical protein